MYRKLDSSVSSSESSVADDSNNGGIITTYKDPHDDDYYLDIDSTPPRFAYYRHVRAEKWKALGHKPWDHVYDPSITQDELDYRLKRELRPSPEQRYQDEKENFLFHDLSCYMRGLDDYGDDSYGCTGAGCIPECRFYPETGRIEDEEVIREHIEIEERERKRNAIVNIDIDNKVFLEFLKKYNFSL